MKNNRIARNPGDKDIDLAACKPVSHISSALDKFWPVKKKVENIRKISSLEQQNDNKLLQPEDRYIGWELDDDAPSEVSPRWESDGSALFDSIDEGETYPII